MPKHKSVRKIPSESRKSTQKAGSKQKAENFEYVPTGDTVATQQSPSATAESIPNGTPKRSKGKRSKIKRSKTNNRASLEDIDSNNNAQFVVKGGHTMLPNYYTRALATQGVIDNFNMHNFLADDSAADGRSPVPPPPRAEGGDGVLINVDTSEYDDDGAVSEGASSDDEMDEVPQPDDESEVVLNYNATKTSGKTPKEKPIMQLVEEMFDKRMDVEREKVRKELQEEASKNSEIEREVTDNVNIPRL